MEKKSIKTEIQHKIWDVHFESDDELTIWRYDSKISITNPFQVEILYKNDRSDVRKIANIKKSKQK